MTFTNRACTLFLVPLLLASAALAAETNAEWAADTFCWKDSYGRGVGSIANNPGRVADCPDGYTNNGLTCGRGLQSTASPGRPAWCPDGYEQTGASCLRKDASISAPSKDGICPGNSKYLGLTCQINADTKKAPSMAAQCPGGYTNTGLTCFAGPNSYSAPSRSADCPGANAGWYNNGTTCWNNKWAHGWNKNNALDNSMMTCPGGYSRDGAWCRPACNPGYSFTGETCFFPGASLTSASMSCAAGYFLNQNTGRCYVQCAAAYGPNYTNAGETCYQGPATLTSASMSCPGGYFLNKNTGRCYLNCPAGFTNTGETCDRPASTVGMDQMSCHGDSGTLVGARCYPACPAGWQRTGETCTKWASTLGMDKMSCRPGETKDSARCYGPNACGPGREISAASCYKACNAGYDGVGPVCWSAVPTGWVNCGMGNAKDSATCTKVIASEAVSTSISAATIVACVGTAGVSCTAKEGEETAANASKLAQLRAQLQSMIALVKARKSLVAAGGAVKVGGAAYNGAKTGDQLATETEYPTDADIARMYLEIASIADPSGLTGVAASFSFPKCSALFK